MSHDTTSRPTNPPRPLIPRAIVLEHEQRNRRADELAAIRYAKREQARCRRIQFAPAGEVQDILFTIPSATRPDVEYSVIWYALTTDAYCNCPAGQNEQPCWHAGVARMAGPYVADLYTPERMADAEEDARTERAIDEWRELMYGGEHDR